MEENTMVVEATTAKENAIIDEDNIDAFKLLSMKSQIADLQKLAEDTRSKQSEFGNIGADKDIDVDFIDERIENLTLEEIKALPDAKVDEICTSEDGECILELDDPKKSSEFRRDYLIFRKETNEALKGIDDELLKMNEAYAEYEAEMAEVTKTYSDITNYLKHTLEEKAEKASSEEAAQRFRDMIVMIDTALTLDNMIEYYSKPHRARTAIVNILSPSTGKTIIKKYEEVITSVSCKTDFRKFGGIQAKFLPDEYKDKREDAFMYSLINYIASWHRNEDNTLNGLFLAQLSINLKNLIYDKFTTEEDKQTFINAICKVIDLVE